MTRPPKSADSKNKNKTKNNEESATDSLKTYILNKKESVLRNTLYYTHSKFIRELRLKKTHMLTFRASDEDLEFLDLIMRLRGLDMSKAIREALKVYAGILSGAKEVKPSETLVIQNPVVNIVEPVALAKAESKFEASDSVLLKRLAELKRKLKEYSEMIREYEAEISRLRKELSERDKRIRELEARLSELSPESIRARVEAEVVRRFKSVLINLVRNKVISREQWVSILEAMGW